MHFFFLKNKLEDGVYYFRDAHPHTQLTTRRSRENQMYKYVCTVEVYIAV